MTQARAPGEAIELLGVSTNNLKAVDVAFPLGRVTVVTGVSGSGKSSLVFDSLYGEAYRRYVESLSSFARQYLKALPKPVIREVRHLPPAIAVRQSRSGATNRSTVGTSTELNDLLRILYVHLGRVHCVKCGDLVERDNPETIASKALAKASARTVKTLVAAPLSVWGKVPAKELKAELEAQGFTRLFTAPVDEGSLVSARVIKLAEAKAADMKGAAAVVDRVTLSTDTAPRFREAAALALKLGRGTLWVIDEVTGEKNVYTQGLDCPKCNLSYREPSTALLSFNHPLGACATCTGFGAVSEWDWERIIPDRSASLASGGVAAWNFGAFAEYYDWAKPGARALGLKLDKPFADYTPAEWQWLREGDAKGKFDGIDGFFTYLDSKKYKAHYRIHASRFRLYVTCPECAGHRLNSQALAVRLHGLNLAEASQQSVDAATLWMDDLAAKARSLSRQDTLESRGGMMGVDEALEEGRQRLSYLGKIGVGYLTLDRSARTLSGGELQRLNMARCLGSALTETLFCLDEPSAGLHARDAENLLTIVRELRDQGNTVVLVEHEQRLIRGADHLIEVGPLAGHEGGRIVRAGVPSDIVQESSRGVATARAGVPTRQLGRFLELTKASTHNLKNVTAKFPLGAVTVVSGVSGSGKTSLIQHTLFPLVARALGQPRERGAGRDAGDDVSAAKVGPQPLLETHGSILLMSQAALARSSRSNIATYLGLMDGIRKVLADQPLARQKGLSASAFSFNTAAERGGGRCETCRGLGVVVEDLSFLGEMDVRCPTCDGRRFTEAVLAVDFQGKNLIQILELTAAEARVFFAGRKDIAKACDQAIAMGLGYVTLGQSTSSFSGGEAQRLKLLALLGEVRGEKPSILVFDEPSTGLADADVAMLIGQLHSLADRGHTVIVVEHHLEVLRAADWLVDMGPEAAERGGQLVYQGPPGGIGAATASVTARFL